MTKRELKIAAISACMASLLGIGVNQTIAGAASPTIENATVRLGYNTDDKGVKAMYFEVCAQAIAAGAPDAPIDQGCESAKVPEAFAAKADALMSAATAYWANQRGIK
jgi:hypothetical protein